MEQNERLKLERQEAEVDEKLQQESKLQNVFEQMKAANDIDGLLLEDVMAFKKELQGIAKTINKELTLE